MNFPDKDHFTDIDGNPIEDSPEPSPCRFCGSEADQLVVERWSTEDDPDASYHVEMPQVRVQRPTGDTQLEDAEARNGRNNG